MKPRRHRVPPAPVVIHVHPSGDRACPWCNRTYEVALPMLGEHGVAMAYSHRIDADRSNWCMPTAVMGDPDNNVDNDDFCVYEVDNTPMGEGAVA